MAHHVTPEVFPAPVAAPPLWTSYSVAVAAAATSRTVVQSVMMMMIQVKTTREVAGKETDRHPRSLNRQDATRSNYQKCGAGNKSHEFQQRDQSGRWTRVRKNFMLVSLEMVEFEMLAAMLRSHEERERWNEWVSRELGGGRQREVGYEGELRVLLRLEQKRQTRCCHSQRSRQQTGLRVNGLVGKCATGHWYTQSQIKCLPSPATFIFTTM